MTTVRSQCLNEHLATISYQHHKSKLFSLKHYLL